MQNDYHTKKACIMTLKRKQYHTQKRVDYFLCVQWTWKTVSNSAQYKTHVDTGKCVPFIFFPQSEKKPGYSNLS